MNRIPKTIFALALSPPVLCLIDLLILVPIATGTTAVLHDLKTFSNLQEMTEILAGIGVILIGWGVALEEREPLRALAGLKDGPDETRQHHLDHISHTAGMGLLLLGLFTEIAVEIVKIPNHVINSEGIDHILIAIASALIIAGGLVIVANLVQLVTAMLRASPPPIPVTMPLARWPEPPSTLPGRAPIQD